MEVLIQMLTHENKQYYFDSIKEINIATLKHMYSPLFDKTFDELTDQEIKEQLDLWIETGEHSEIFQETKPLTKEQQQYLFRTFVGGKHGKRKRY